MRFAIVIFISTVLAANAFAQDDIDGDEIKDEAARAAFSEGLRFYNYLHYADALNSFKRAYALRPTYRILYNIGQVQMMLSHPDLALESFEAYLTEGGGEITARRRAAVERDIAKLREKVGEVEVDGPRGAEIWLDGERRGFLPLAGAIRIAQGNHVLILINPKNETRCEKKLSIAGGLRSTAECTAREMETVDVPRSISGEITLGAMPLADPSAAGIQLPRIPRDKIAPIAVSAMGVVTLVVAIVCAGKARNLNAKLNDTCDGGDCPAGYADEIEKLPRYAGAADGFFISTAVLGAVAATLFVAPWKKKESKTDIGHSTVAATRSLGERDLR